MARNLKEIYNIDKLKLSAFQPDGFFEYFASFKKNDFIGRDGYKMMIADDGRGRAGDATPSRIVIVLMWEDNKEIGILTLNSSSTTYGGRAFVEVDNKQFYTPFSFDLESKQKIPMMGCIAEILDDLGLQVASVTQIDIARDLNMNIIKPLRNMIADASFDMICNNKKITDPLTKIGGYSENYGRCRKHMFRVPTIYYSQAKERTPELKIYNKTREIEESSNKNYIAEWNGFGKESIFRSELTLYWDSVKEWMKENDIDIADPLSLKRITAPKSLMSMYETFSPRLIRFVSSKGSVYYV